MTTFASSIAAIWAQKAKAGFGIFQVSGGDPWTTLDGRLGAPAGVAQYPNLLSIPAYDPLGIGQRLRVVGGSYATNATGRRQPGWMVAGVDYPVGLNYDTTFASGGTVITKNSHNFANGFGVTFYTTGTLPSPLVAGTTYYVRSVNQTTNTFEISASWTSVLNGSTAPAITFASSGTGLHIALIDLTAGTNDLAAQAWINKQNTRFASGSFDWNQDPNALRVRLGNVTLDNIDGTVPTGTAGVGGVFIEVFTGTPANVTIRNCLFKIPAPAAYSAPFIGAGGNANGDNWTVTQCVIDGNFPNVVNNKNQMNAAITLGGKNLTITYNWFKQYIDSPVDISGGRAADGVLYAYNLIDSCMSSTGSHGEAVHWDAQFSSGKFIFNTSYSPAANVNGFPGTWGTCALVFLQSGAVTSSNLEIGNNTMVSLMVAGPAFGHRDGADCTTAGGSASGFQVTSCSQIPHTQDQIGGTKVKIMHAPTRNDPHFPTAAFPDTSYATWTGSAGSVVYTIFTDATLSTHVSFANAIISDPSTTQIIPYSLNNTAVNEIIELDLTSTTLNGCNIHENFYDLLGVDGPSGNGGGMHFTASGSGSTLTGLVYSLIIDMRTGNNLNTGSGLGGSMQGGSLTGGPV